MKMISAWKRIVRIAGACAAGCVVLICWVPSAASAQSTQPAFDTYQAPGGAATAGKRVIALTFDDGPGSYTPQVLSVLERYHVPATFFEIGENVVEYPQYTQTLVAAGYPVEDHTWTHPNLTTIPASQFPYQIDQTQNEIRSLTGETPTCVRPPYDDWNTTALGQIAQRGLTAMSYSIDPRDWTLPGVQDIVNGVVGAAFPGAVVDMHDGGGDRSETVAALPQIITDLESNGYAFVSICGGLAPVLQTSTVYSFGGAPAPGSPITSDNQLVAAAVDPQSSGYWLAARNGGVFSFGAAGLHGSLPGLGISPAQPIVGMAASPGGNGYWLVAADGGVFSFGDAVFYGSMGGKPLDMPIVGMAASPDGNGYWLVAADGGVFSFGDAAFRGSMGGSLLNAPVVGLAVDPATGGYWLVAADGGVFSFGDAAFYGSRGGLGGDDRYFAISATANGSGYLLAAQHPT